MKKQILFILLGILPLCIHAQLNKQMSKYHEKDGITITQLDKSLYGLYQRENLSTETKEMLQKLDEVNILNLDLENAKPNVANEIITQFRDILDTPGKYKLVKSHNNSFSKQLIYSKNKNGKISDLVVWNQSPQQIDIIELQGDIQLDRIALLARALNLNGLNSLNVLSDDQNSNEYDPTARLRQAQEASRKFRSEFDGLESMFGQFLNPSRDTTDWKNYFRTPFGNLEEIMSLFADSMSFNHLPAEFFNMNNNGTLNQIEEYFQSSGNEENIISHSVQITEENGKTKLRIDSKNSDITYIIDGQKVSKDSLQIPEQIRGINLIPSKEDMRKGYVFITSNDQIGDFISYKNGILTFKYNQQEYKYNLDKAQEPLLVVDGRLVSSFNIRPIHILQIRPISQAEKEIGYYPNAQVIINTK